MGTYSNSADPDQMPQNVAPDQGLQQLFVLYAKYNKNANIHQKLLKLEIGLMDRSNSLKRVNINSQKLAFTEISGYKVKRHVLAFIVAYLQRQVNMFPQYRSLKIKRKTGMMIGTEAGTEIITGRCEETTLKKFL